MNKKKIHTIENLRIDSQYISFRVDQRDYRFLLSEVSPRLAIASDEERNRFRISSSGYGIHWDLINEDLSIKGLINNG